MDDKGKPISELVAGVMDSLKLGDEYYARVERELADREKSTKAEADARAAWSARAALLRRDIPAKDVERLLANDLRESQAIRAARGFLESVSARILVLAGRRGCGKTTAASWVIAQECPDEYFDRDDWRARTWPLGRHPRFLASSRLLRLSRYDEDKMGPYETCSMLAIDDLGIAYEDVKGAFASLLDGLVDARYEAQLRTVITTNMRADEFKQHYGERVADRIRECGRFVEIADESMRGK